MGTPENVKLVPVKPVKPEDVCTNIDVSDKDIALINSLLTKSWSKYERASGRWIDAALLPHQLWNDIIHIYRLAGWSVEYRSCQRDGDSVLFTPPVTK